MNVKSPYVSGLLLLCALSFAARAPAQSTRLVITEGHSIGYATVADALADLESQGLTSTPGANGDVSFVAPDNGTAWTFAGKDNPAYPSVVRYVYTRSSGELHAEVAIRCEASAKTCEKFHSDIRDRLAQLSRKMAGDPAAKCSVSGDTMTCGAEADRQPPH